MNLRTKLAAGLTAGLWLGCVACGPAANITLTAPPDAGDSADSSDVAADGGGAGSDAGGSDATGPAPVPVPDADAAAGADGSITTFDAGGDAGALGGDSGGEDATDATTGDAASGADGQSNADAGTAPDSGGSTNGDSGGSTTETCGDVYCRGGQACVASVCVYQSCSGVHVPGDYATVQSAVTALQAGGGTICLGAQTYVEDVAITGLGGSLTITGVTAAQTGLTSIVFSGVASGATNVSLTVQGVGFTGPSELLVTQSGVTAEVNVTNCVFGPTDKFTLFAEATGATGSLMLNILYSTIVASTGNYGLMAEDSTQEAYVALTLDGDDISGGATAVFAGFGQPVSTVVLENSYLHDANGGFTFSSEETPARIVNNVFENLQNGAQMAGEQNVRLYNNLFVTNQTAIALNGEDLSQIGEDALWQNLANYGGTATPGTGMITTDPLLDSTTTPPTLKSGSPCIGSANTDVLPPTDYWGHRRTKADLGPVQSN